jgi:putative endopeptidase
MKNLFLVLSAASLGLFSCNEVNHYDSAKSTDILAEHIDTTTNPADDYFQYSNGRWLKANPIPDDETSWGIAHLVNEELYKRKLKINEDAAQKRGSS